MNKKAFILGILLVLFSKSVLSQAPKELQKKDSVKLYQKDSLLRLWLLDQCYCDVIGSCDKKKYYYTGRQYISNYSMNRLIRRDITKITLDEEGLPVLGNYASLKIADDKSKVTLNTSWYNIFRKKEESDPIRSVLSVNIKAGLNEGVASIFTNKNVNNEAGIKIKYSVIGKNTLYENNSSLDCNRLKLHRERLLYEYDDLYKGYKMDSLKYKRKQKKSEVEAFKQRQLDTLFNKQLDLLKTNLTGIVTNLKNVVGQRTEQQLEEDLRTDINFRIAYETLINNKFLYDSLINQKSIEIDSNKSLILDFLKAYTLFQSSKPNYKMKEGIDSFYKRLLNLETENVRWTRFRLQWFDIDVDLNGKKYNLFDNRAVIDSQLSKKNFTQWTVGFSFNRFISNSSFNFLRYGLFLKGGYSVSNTNNLVNAETKEITTTVNIDTPNFRRQIISKTNAYELPFLESCSHNFKLQASKYLNEKRNSAISLYSSLALNFNKFKTPFKIEGKPDLAAGLSYLMAFQDKDKEKNIINVEVFFSFNDILNSAEEKDSKFFQRHDLGLKFGVPFNSLFINQ